MLAAASSRSDQTLQSVRLVLILESKNQNYPEKLKDYFREVITQTVGLLDKPADNAKAAMPEAIALAVKLSADEALRKLIEEILENDEISSEQAGQALISLEASFDPTSEPAHFGREIYAAI